jgi:hypothetical protein
LRDDARFSADLLPSPSPCSSFRHERFSMIRLALPRLRRSHIACASRAYYFPCRADDIDIIAEIRYVARFAAPPARRRYYYELFHIMPRRFSFH